MLLTAHSTHRHAEAGDSCVLWQLALFESGRAGKGARHTVIRRLRSCQSGRRFRQRPTRSGREWPLGCCAHQCAPRPPQTPSAPPPREMSAASGAASAATSSPVQTQPRPSVHNCSIICSITCNLASRYDLPSAENFHVQRNVMGISNTPQQRHAPSSKIDGRVCAR